MTTQHPWTPIPGRGISIPAEKRIADFVSALHARDGVGPTAHTIRDMVFEHGLHPAQFAAFMTEAQTQSLIESYVDDAGAQRFRPTTHEE